MRHTPGPWEARPLSIDFSEKEEVGISGDVRINFKTDRMSVPEMTFNAHLVAAAPEMFEALKKAEEWVSSELNELDEQGFEISSEEIDLHDKIKSVLAKADGRGGNSGRVYTGTVEGAQNDGTNLDV